MPRQQPGSVGFAVGTEGVEVEVVCTNQEDLDSSGAQPLDVQSSGEHCAAQLNLEAAIDFEQGAAPINDAGSRKRLR